MSTPRLRTPGRGLAPSPHGAGQAKKSTGPKTQPAPSNNFTDIPKYTQEELDNDVVNPKLSVYIYERVIVFLSFVSMIVYMAWRWQCFLTRPSTLWISLPLILSETTLVFPGLFVSYFMILHRIHRPVKRLADLKLAPSQLPAVDVFIPCLNEPADLVRDTLIAASNMDYPKEKLTLCVCDDGRRAEIKNMVEGVAADCKSRQNVVTIKYLAREKIPGVPHHAKAGNLNNAILGKENNKEGAARNTQGQFLVIFDCDMVCDAGFLQAILPHFYMRTEEGHKVDESVALVQSPQSFIGVPLNDPLGQQYRYFYGPVLQGWDGAGSAPCCGTNVIFQRKCMESIGGFVYGSVTEDFLTSMYLHDAGFKSKYVHEYLARGLSPDSLGDFMKQRLRWAAGAVEIFFKHNAIYRPGLTWKQTYLYFWSGLQALLAFPSLLVCVTPFVSIIDHNIQVAPMQANQYSYYMGSFMFFTIWMLIISYRDVPKLYLMRSIQESVFMLNCKLQAVFQVALQGNVKFVTTKKDAVKQSPIRQDLGHIFPHLCYYAFSFAAAVLVIYNYLTHKTPHEKLAGQGICFIWIFVVLWQLYPPIGVVTKEIFEHLRTPANSDAVADPKMAGIATVTPRQPDL